MARSHRKQPLTVRPPAAGALRAICVLSMMRCACTKGFFKPVLEKRGEVAVDPFGEESDERPLDHAERRKREIEAKLAKKQAAEKAQKEKEAEERRRSMNDIA